MDEGAGTGLASVWRTFALRVGGAAHRRARRRHHRLRVVAFAARAFRRHHHAERAALRAPSQRRARHPAGRASTPDSRAGRSAVDVRPGVALALSAGLAHSFHRVFGQQRRALRAGAAARWRRRLARSALVQRLDWRAAVDAARRGRCPAGREVAAGRRSGRRGDEPKHPDREGVGRCADCDLSERRTAASGERISDAAPAARLGRQREREVAAAAEGHRRAGHDEGRDIEVHRPPAGRTRRCSSRSRWR